jgi:homoserine dehydrogenase
MSNASSLRIGLFGFGVVGQGLYDVLGRTPSLNTRIERICVRDRKKERSLPIELFTYDKEILLQDPNVDVVVELIDDAEAAFHIVRDALLAGKAVVSANKRMIASRLPELLELQRTTGRPFLYEAAVAGSIPILRNLEEYYDNDLLSSVQGIVNGTTNFMLTRIAEGNGDEKDVYGEALKLAQQKGFAESDPTMDVEGWDPAFKTVLLALHGFGVVLRPEQVVRKGISSIRRADARWAAERGATIKLIARVVVNKGRVSASVLPTVVPNTDHLAKVNNELNAVQLQAAFADSQLLVGKGAGGGPTASAVLSDLSALRYDYRYSYRKLAANTGLVVDTERIGTFYASGAAADVNAIPLVKLIAQGEAEGLRWVVGVSDARSPKMEEVFTKAGLFWAEVAPEVAIAGPAVQVALDEASV